MEWKSFDWKSQKVGQKGEVLNKTVYKCGFCKGAGLISSKGNARCPVCLGDGTVRVAAPAVICAYCNGEGRANLNRDLGCSVCKGKGVVTIESKEIQNCPACKGTGKECNSGLPCLTCKGKGVLPKTCTNLT